MNYQFNFIKFSILSLLLINLQSCESKSCIIDILNGVTIQSPPYAYLTPDNEIKGFAVDLMDEIGERCGFNYGLYYTPDNRYGMITENSSSGMIGEVYNKRADFAVADITVTEQREQYIDFTERFMTSNLAALISKQNIGDIKSFSDLANDSDLKYGVIRNGSTYRWFSQSEDPVFKKMFKYMTENPDNLVKSTEEAIERIRNSKFALIGESSVLKYRTGFECDLTYIEETVSDYKPQYALVLPQKSIYLEKFNNAIKQIKSNGVLDKLINKYWKNEC